MARLTRPGTRGCEWDLAQDFKSIAPYTIEEAYEVSEAIERGDMDELKAELGDLLLQVVFHARMAQEAETCSLSRMSPDPSVTKWKAAIRISFGDEAGTMDAKRWEDLKADRTLGIQGSTSAMDGVANALCQP